MATRCELLHRLNVCTALLRGVVSFSFCIKFWFLQPPSLSSKPVTFSLAKFRLFSPAISLFSVTRLVSRSTSPFALPWFHLCHSSHSFLSPVISPSLPAPHSVSSSDPLFSFSCFYPLPSLWLSLTQPVHSSRLFCRSASADR